MAHERISFHEMDWVGGNHPLEKKKMAKLGGATLLRFEPGFSDPNWCPNGHVGYVLEGILQFEYRDKVVKIGAGEGFIIDPKTLHRASNPGSEAVTLFIAPRS